jgi:hypothetical protein
MTSTKTTFLLPTDDGIVSPPAASTCLVKNIFIISQAIFLAFFLFGTSYSEEDYEMKEYIAFPDIMAMLLLGFGYLMTFLKNYGLGVIGFTMMLSILSMEANLLIKLLLRLLVTMESGA